MDAWMHVRTHACVHARMHVCMRVYMHVGVQHLRVGRVQARDGRCALLCFQRQPLHLKQAKSSLASQVSRLKSSQVSSPVKSQVQSNQVLGQVKSSPSHVKSLHLSCHRGVRCLHLQSSMCACKHVCMYVSPPELPSWRSPSASPKQHVCKQACMYVCIST